MKILDFYNNFKINKTVKNKFCRTQDTISNHIDQRLAELPRVTIPLFNKRNVYKQECINALTCEMPFERVFVVDSKTDALLAKLDGGVNTCTIPRKLLKGQNVAILHGHPKLSNGLTSPISLQDFIVLNSEGVSEIVVYNSSGGQSVLKKTNKFKTLSGKGIEELKSNFIKHLYEYADDETKVRLDNLFEYVHKKKDSDLIKQEIADILTELQTKECGIIATDDFWRVNAAKYGLEYIPFNT